MIDNKSLFVFFSYRFQTKDKSTGWGRCQSPIPGPVTMDRIKGMEEFLTAAGDYEWVTILNWRRMEQESDPIESE